jgi:F-box protein 11
MEGFWSYARHDADGDQGNLDELRKYLERRIGQRLGLGANLKLWRDRSQLAAGQLWSDEIEAQIAKSNAFIAVVTPNWLASPHCRKELLQFVQQPGAMNSPRIIFPLYLHSSSLLDTDDPAPCAETRRTAEILKARQWSDWRQISGELEDTGLQSREVMNKAREFAENIAVGLVPRPHIQQSPPLPQLNSGTRRRVPVPPQTVERPRGPARIDIDRSPNIAAPDELFVRPDVFFNKTEVMTPKYIFNVEVARARLRLDAVGGVVKRDTIAGRGGEAGTGAVLTYLGAQEWRIDPATATTLTDCELSESGLCTLAATSDDLGAVVSLVAAPGDFYVDEGSVRTGREASLGWLAGAAGRNASKLVKIWLSERASKRLERDYEDVILGQAMIMTRLEA